MADLATLAGQLKLKDPSNWAYDPTYESAVNNINAGLAGLQSGQNTSIQRLNEDYNTNVSNAAQSNEQNLKALQEKLANQGIGFSGINVAEQGKIGQNYQQQLGNLAQAKQRSLTDLATDYATKQTDYQNQMNQAQIDRANRESALEQQQAQDEAQAAASKQLADQQRQWMTDMQNKLLAQVQPQVQPTGQMNVPKPNLPAIVNNTPPPSPPANKDQILQMQGVLRLAGFDPGPLDGIAGAKTIAALNKYRTTHGMNATGSASVDDFNNLQNWLNQSQVP